MALIRTQVAIAGAGMVGLSLAVALAKLGREVVVIERQQAKRNVPEQTQVRVSALSAGSQAWLEELGVWGLLPKPRLGPYLKMTVWDRDNGADIHFDAGDAGMPALGHIIENSVVEACLWQRAEALGVRIIDAVELDAPEFHEQDVTLSLSNGDIVLTQLLVAADGARSALREQSGTPMVFKDYEQHALVANIDTQHPHQQTARQAFMPGGPLALLPLADTKQVSIVWTRPPLEAERLLQLDDKTFNRELTAASDSTLGSLTLASQRYTFPLQMRYAERWVTQRLVLIGDAAHTIHPLAGQGANLGIGDARDLSQRLGELGTLNGLWDEAELSRTLRSYQRARKAAAVQQIATMEGFHQLFRTANPMVRGIRRLGLNFVNQQPLLKQLFLGQASK